MVKGVIILVVVSLIGSAGTWIVLTVQEKERLEAELVTAVSVNEVNIAELDKLKADAQLKQKQTLQRAKLQQAQRDKIYGLKRKLKAAKKSLTVTERECMEAPVPASVIDFLRLSTEAGETAASREDVSQ